MVCITTAIRSVYSAFRREWMGLSPSMRLERDHRHPFLSATLRSINPGHLRTTFADKELTVGRVYRRLKRSSPGSGIAVLGAHRGARMALNLIIFGPRPRAPRLLDALGAAGDGGQGVGADDAFLQPLSRWCRASSATCRWGTVRAPTRSATPARAAS